MWAFWSELSPWRGWCRRRNLPWENYDGNPGRLMLGVCVCLCLVSYNSSSFVVVPQERKWPQERFAHARAFEMKALVIVLRWRIKSGWTWLYCLAYEESWAVFKENKTRTSDKILLKSAYKSILLFGSFWRPWLHQTWPICQSFCK